MGKPTSQILAVLELLQTYGQLSGTELSDRLGIEKRTLRRYIIALEDLGIPIMSERGRYGGYKLISGFKLQPMMFDENEALALSLGLISVKQTELVESLPAIETARAKLTRILPAALKQQAKDISHAVSVDLLPKRGGLTLSTRFLLILSTAISKKRQVEMHYKTANNIFSQRNIDPYGLSFYLGYWYLVGFCHLRQSSRTFRLDRVLAIEILDIQYVPPVDFDIISHLRHMIATIPRQFTAEILLKTDLETATKEIDHTMGLLTHTENGVILHHQCDDLAWFARQLAFWPFEFTVIQPTELFTELKKVATRIMGSLE